MLGREIPANTRITITRDVLAECAWEYGEDDLAARVAALSDEELDQVQGLALWHRTNDPEPEGGPKLTNARIETRALIEFFEGRTRETKRTRRRTRPREGAVASG